MAAQGEIRKLNGGDGRRMYTVPSHKKVLGPCRKIYLILVDIKFFTRDINYKQSMFPFITRDNKPANIVYSAPPTTFIFARFKPWVIILQNISPISRISLFREFVENLLKNYEFAVFWYRRKNSRECVQTLPPAPGPGFIR